MATFSSAARYMNRVRGRSLPLARRTASSAVSSRSSLTAPPPPLQSPLLARSFSTDSAAVDATPTVGATTTVAPPSPSETFVPRFSTPVSPRSLTSTTAALWALRRSPTTLPLSTSSPSSPPPIPTLSSESTVYPRHPRFESMDRQLSSHLTHLTSLSSTRPYLLPSDSALSILLPLHSSPALYDQYVRFDGGIRFEKVLEDLDAFAANVSHLHLLLGSSKPDGAYLPPSHVMLVTASVDSIIMQRRFPMDRDVVMRGRVTWVGTSSLEVNISIYAIEPKVPEGSSSSGSSSLPPLEPPSAPPPGTSPDRWERTSVMTAAEQQQQLQGEGEGEGGEADIIDPSQLPPRSTYTESKLLDAVFLMVARSVESGKATPVCPLSVEHMTQEELAEWERGERNRERRKRDQERSLVRSPPTDEEVALLHSLLMPHSSSSPSPSASHPTPHPPSHPALNPPPHSLPGAIIRPKSCPMSSTAMTSSSMTQPQERNTNGKIFGGSLMRGAYELARTCAYVFGGPGSRPYLIASDVITFLRPVEIGSVIEFRARVVYAAGVPERLFQVRVETEVRALVSGERFVSNTFQFTFECDSVPLRRVEPGLYSEAMEWLEGRRLVLKAVERKRGEQLAKETAGGGGGGGGDAESINEQGVQVHN